MGQIEGPTVLVVDDDQPIRDVLQMMLELEDYGVLLASNGKEALETLAKSPTPPCLILLDLMMPVMNGWQFVEEIKKIESLATIPIIIITAFREKAETIKADGVLLKPIEYDQLLAAIQNHCGKRRT